MSPEPANLRSVQFDYQFGSFRASAQYIDGEIVFKAPSSIPDTTSTPRILLSGPDGTYIVEPNQEVTYYSASYDGVTFQDEDLLEAEFAFSNLLEGDAVQITGPDGVICEATIVDEDSIPCTLSKRYISEPINFSLNGI